jgi:hypothetical protein
MQPPWRHLSSPESQTSLLRSVVLMPLRGTIFLFLFCYYVFLYFCCFSSLVLFSVHLFYVSVVYFLLFLLFLVWFAHNGQWHTGEANVRTPGAIVRRSPLQSAKHTEEVNVHSPLGDCSLLYQVHKGARSSPTHTHASA